MQLKEDASHVQVMVKNVLIQMFQILLLLELIVHVYLMHTKMVVLVHFVLLVAQMPLLM